MKLYIAQCYDRHIDPVIRVFDDPDKAIKFAAAFVVEMSRDPDFEDEEPDEGFIFRQCYSSEGDYVMVEETELNDDSLE